MSDPQYVEDQFDRLSRASIEQYESGLARLNDKRAYADARSLRRNEKVGMQLGLAGVDSDRLEELHRRDEDDLDEYLDHVRPALVDQKFDGAADARVTRSREAVIQEAGGRLIRPYAAVVLAPHKKWIEHIDGRAGNPWIMPSNPEIVNIWQRSRGAGIGNCLGGPDFTHDGMIRHEVWFQFVPDKTSDWELTAIISYRGFWILRADDGFLSCSYAGLLLRTTLDVHQYFWTGSDRRVYLDKKDSHIEDNQRFDETPYQWTRVHLLAGDAVWVRATIEMVAFAAGAGSFAEINFSDGANNFVKPLLVSALAL